MCITIFTKEPDTRYDTNCIRQVFVYNGFKHLHIPLCLSLFRSQRELKAVKNELLELKKEHAMSKKDPPAPPSSFLVLEAFSHCFALA